jgi:hypothetical protein
MTGVGAGVSVQVVEVDIVFNTAVNVLVLVVEGMRGQISVGSRYASAALTQGIYRL